MIRVTKEHKFREFIGSISSKTKKKIESSDGTKNYQETNKSLHQKDDEFIVDDDAEIEYEMSENEINENREIEKIEKKAVDHDDDENDCSSSEFSEYVPSDNEMHENQEENQEKTTEQLKANKLYSDIISSSEDEDYENERKEKEKVESFNPAYSFFLYL